MQRMKRRLEPTIGTRRLTLRPPHESDLDDVVAGIGDFSVSRMLARVPHPYTRTDAVRFLHASRANTRAGSGLNLTIEHAGRAIGGIGIHDMPHHTELGYWLRRTSWGKGFATEAADAVLAYGFDALCLPLVRSGYFVGNAGSARVQRKLGFMQVGRHLVHSLAQGTEVAHIDTVLTPARFRQAAR